MEAHRSNTQVHGNGSEPKAYCEAVNFKVDSRALLPTAAWKNDIENFYKGVLGPCHSIQGSSWGSIKFSFKSGCQLSYYMTMPLTMFVKLTIWIAHHQYGHE
jgi:hypothetical protein